MTLVMWNWVEVDNMTQFCRSHPSHPMPLLLVHHTHPPLPTTTTTTTTTPAAKYRFLLPLLVFVVPFFPTVVTFYTTLDNLVTLQYQCLIPPSLLLSSPPTVILLPVLQFSTTTTSPRLCRPVLPYRRDLLHHLGQPRHPPVPAPNTTFSTTFLLPYYDY